MDYFMKLTGGMNIRRSADPNGEWIATLPAGVKVEGDELFKDAANRDWLKVLMMDGVPTTQPAYIATYTTNGKLETYPPPVDPGLAVQVEISFMSASPVQITIDGVPVGQEQYNGTIKISPVG